jgi:hypothetical protein
MLLCLWYSCSTFTEQVGREACFRFRDSAGEYLTGIQIGGSMPPVRYFLPERGDGKFPSP